MTRTRALVDIEALTDLFPHRVARAAELIALGFTANAIYSRCRPGGPWQRIAPGIVLLGTGAPTRPQLIACALSHAGPGAILTGWDALCRHGMSTPAGWGPVHVLLPHNRQVRSDQQIIVERTVNLPSPTLCKGFPITPLPRAAMDTARRLHSTDTARALITEVIRRGRVSPARLRHELDTGSRRGTALPRRILTEVFDGIRSVAEAWARRLVLRAGLPQPRWNRPIRDPAGELLGIVDAWWDDVGLAWDLGAYQFTPSPADRTEAIRRTSRLTAAGIIVVYTPADHLRQHPVTVLEELRRAHHHAAQRPRPAVITEVAGAS